MTDMGNLFGAVAGGAITIYMLDTLLKKQKKEGKKAKSHKLKRVI
jgi:hypothetical protein